MTTNSATVAASPWAAPKPRFFVPEVVQTSATDCGPATLKALLEGFGISVSYDRLREACQTSLDGSSIDTLEDVASLLGMDAQQLLIPADHLLLPESGVLPAIVVTQLPGGATHFVLLWRTHGRFVQVMDPAIGRRWLTAKRFQQEIFTHRMSFPASVWREWAGGDAFCTALSQRLAKVGVTQAKADELIRTARDDTRWHTLAGLDAVVRQAQSLVMAGGLLPGAEVSALIERLFQRICRQEIGPQPPVPWSYWSVQPVLAAADESGDAQLQVQGAVVLKMDPSPVAQAITDPLADADVPPPPAIHAELAAALNEKPMEPMREIWAMLQEDGLLAPGLVAVALLLAGVGVTVQALFLRSLTELWRNPLLADHRLTIFMILIGLSGLLVLVEVPALTAMLRSGRRVETRLRLAFLQKLPRINDRYFRSRLTSDMARRAHHIQSLRGVPMLGYSLVQNFALLLATALGLIWLDPASATLVLGVVLGNLALIFAAQPLHAELDLRLQNHAAGLSRFFLDVLRGLIPVRSHSAGGAIRQEHEARLVELYRTSRTVNSFSLAHDGLIALFNTLVAVVIVFFYISREREAAGVLLLLYWTLNMPVLAQRLAGLARQYPRQRNHLARILEPLGAAEEPSATVAAFSSTQQAAVLHLSAVQVVAGGHTILDGVDLTVSAGEHVAIVGRSGAGKSSLVGLLLGWRTPAAGEVRVDGLPLTPERLQALRRTTAWVDPEVQIWNRSLLENLRYGRENQEALPTGAVLGQANLTDVLRSLPSGMQTRLGEGGGLVSGGEGQRVRLGRALMQSAPRLALLDEPFRDWTGISVTSCWPVPGSSGDRPPCSTSPTTWPGRSTLTGCW